MTGAPGATGATGTTGPAGLTGPAGATGANSRGTANPARRSRNGTASVRIVQRSHRRPDLGGHRLRLDQGLAREVAAPLGQLLVLQVDRRRARSLEQPHRPLDVERLAEAGVGVAQQRQGRRPRQPPGLVGELGLRHQADVGQPQRRRQGGPGQVDGPEAETLGHAGDQGGEDAGQLQRRR